MNLPRGHWCVLWRNHCAGVSAVVQQLRGIVSRDETQVKTSEVAVVACVVNQLLLVYCPVVPGHRIDCVQLLVWWPRALCL